MGGRPKFQKINFRVIFLAAVSMLTGYCSEFTGFKGLTGMRPREVVFHIVKPGASS